MKKLILLLTLVISYTTFADTVEFSFDWNNSTEYTMKNGFSLKKQDDDFSYTIEAYGKESQGAAIGWGTSFSRIYLGGLNKGEVNLTPLYMTTKYYLNRDTEVKVFLKVHGGGYLNQGIFGKTEISGIRSVDIDNGWYYGAGGGFEFKGFIVQAMYKQYIGDATVDGLETKFDYYTTSITLAYAVEM